MEEEQEIAPQVLMLDLEVVEVLEQVVVAVEQHQLVLVFLVVLEAQEVMAL
jgi:hypothetical protein